MLNKIISVPPKPPSYTKPIINTKAPTNNLTQSPSTNLLSNPAPIQQGGSMPFGVTTQNNPSPAGSTNIFGLGTTTSPVNSIFSGKQQQNQTQQAPQHSMVGSNTVPNPFNKPFTHSNNQPAPTGSQFFSNTTLNSAGSFLQQNPTPQHVNSSIPQNQWGECYPTFKPSPCFFDLAEPLNVKVSHANDPDEKQRHKNKIKCISGIRANLESGKNKEILRVQFYSSKLGIAISSPQNMNGSSQNFMGSNSLGSGLFGNKTVVNKPNPFLTGNSAQPQQQTVSNGWIQPSSANTNATPSLFQNITNSNTSQNIQNPSGGQASPQGNQLFSTANPPNSIFPFLDKKQANLNDRSQDGNRKLVEEWKEISRLYWSLFIINYGKIKYYDHEIFQCLKNTSFSSLADANRIQNYYFLNQDEKPNRRKQFEQAMYELSAWASHHKINFDLFRFYFDCVSSDGNIKDLLLCHIKQKNPDLFPAVEVNDLQLVVELNTMIQSNPNDKPFDFDTNDESKWQQSQKNSDLEDKNFQFGDDWFHKVPKKQSRWRNYSETQPMFEKSSQFYAS